MADAVQHRRALFARSLDAPLHLDEGIAGLTNFARAARLKFEIAPLSEILGGGRQSQDRANLIAQKQDRHEQQHDRRAEHPEDEDVDVGVVGEASPGDETQHAEAEIDADLQQSGAADRVDPKRIVDLALEFVGQLPGQRVQNVKKRVRHPRRQRLRRHQFDIQAQTLGGDLAQPLVVRSARELAIEVDQRADVSGQRRRQPLSDQFRVTLHEDIGDRGLQQHHRKDDDQEGARVKSLRQQVCEETSAAPPHQASSQKRLAPDRCERRGHGSTTSL